MRKLLVLLIIVSFSMTTQACEICGCGLGNYYIGILPQFSQKFIGLRYQVSHYHTRLTDDPDEFSNDLYQTIELWSGLNIGKRWQILVFVPFNFSHQVADDGITDRSGFGDVAVLGHYKLLDKMSKTSGNKNVAQQLWIGAGIKLPTGKFDIEPSDPDVAAAANGQLGTGSADFMLNALYSIHIDRLGISANANYKINTNNDHHYEFGNKFTANSFIYYSIAAPSLRSVFTPNVGLLYENAGTNKLENEKLELTGGNLVTAAAGVEMSFNKTTIGFNAQLPVAQDFAAGQTRSKWKGMVHVTFSL